MLPEITILSESTILPKPTTLPEPTIATRGEEQLNEGKEYDFQSASEYFTKLQEVFATFADRSIFIEDIEKLVDQSNYISSLL